VAVAPPLPLVPPVDIAPPRPPAPPEPLPPCPAVPPASGLDDEPPQAENVMADTIASDDTISFNEGVNLNDVI
jgi:hypothetical protein